MYSIVTKLWKMCYPHCFFNLKFPVTIQQFNTKTVLVFKTKFYVDIRTIKFKHTLMHKMHSYIIQLEYKNVIVLCVVEDQLGRAEPQVE